MTSGRPRDDLEIKSICVHITKALATPLRVNPKLQYKYRMCFVGCNAYQDKEKLVKNVYENLYRLVFCVACISRCMHRAHFPVTCVSIILLYASA